MLGSTVPCNRSSHTSVRTVDRDSLVVGRRTVLFSCLKRQSTRSLPRSLLVTAQSTGSNLLQKLGRVLKEKAAGDFDRVFKGTSKSREQLGLVEELFTYWNLDKAEEVLDDLEEKLIESDFGPSTAFKVVDGIREKVTSGSLKTGDDIRNELKSAIIDILQKAGESTLLPGADKPGVILIVGVNGGGKTTTIGKLAHKFGREGAKVLVAAGDTFRAAAEEQLREWAGRAGADIIGRRGEKQRPDALLYEAVEKAIKIDADVLICDTSGRLHTNVDLMAELAKCKQAIGKRLEGAPQEVLLVLDGTTGLNMLNQAREFNETVQVTGLILTKLDGTARGGAVVSVVDDLAVPVKFVGVGEGVDDLQPFDAPAFVNALFPSI